MISYLLINKRKFIPYKDKWRLFDTMDLCLEEARKLGWESNPLMGHIGAHVGNATSYMCLPAVDLTIIAVQVETQT